MEGSLDIRHQLTTDVQEWVLQSSQLSTVRKVNTRRGETMVESDERRYPLEALEESPLAVVLLFKSATWDSVVSPMRSSFPSNGVRAAVSSSRVYVAYVRACIMQEDGPRSRNISPPPAHRRPKCIHPIIFASPCPTFHRPPPRASLVVPQLSPPLPLYSLSSLAHLHGMHSYEIDHSSADFSSGHFLPPPPSSSPSLFSSLARTHSRHDRLQSTWHIFRLSSQRGKSHWGYSGCNARRRKLVRQ